MRYSRDFDWRAARSLVIFAGRAGEWTQKNYITIASEIKQDQPELYAAWRTAVRLGAVEP